MLLFWTPSLNSSQKDAVRTYAEGSCDAVGIMLCIRVNIQHQLIMQNRQLTILDHFLTTINQTLWPRFQAVMDLHVGSVRKAVATGASGFFAGNMDSTPHYVTRRYGEFVASLLSLNHGYEDALLDARSVVETWECFI